MRTSQSTYYALLAVALLLGSVAATPGSGGLEGASGTAPAAAAADHTATHVNLTSPVDDATIPITVFRPAGSSSGDPVPVLLHGHGWTGSRWTNVSQAEPYLDAGFAVVSIDQRGHGESTAEARVMDPEYEGRDIMHVIDYAAGLGWVALDGTGDPVLGALGGSYGGGYQFITALEETRLHGDTRFDALAPEITWFNLTDSLAPNDVVRSLWVDALYWGAKARGVALHPSIDEAYAHAMATGSVPDETAHEFYTHSPAWYADQGVQLDVPVLTVQGVPDTLFNLNQALRNQERTLTPAAQANSTLVGQLTGHVLPSAYPPGMLPHDRGTPCIDGFHPDPPEGVTSKEALYIAWYTHHLKPSQTASVPSSPAYLSTEDGSCVAFQSLEDLRSTTAVDVADLTPEGTPVVAGPAGAPVHLEVLQGPATVAGIPTLDAFVASAGPDARVLVGLAVGSSPATATVVDSQWMPLRLPGVAAEGDVAMDLAGVAVDVPEGASLYLVLSPTSDQFAHHSTRGAAGVLLQDVTVGVPAVS